MQKGGDAQGAGRLLLRWKHEGVAEVSVVLCCMWCGRKGMKASKRKGEASPPAYHFFFLDLPFLPLLN